MDLKLCFAVLYCFAVQSIVCKNPGLLIFVSSSAFDIVQYLWRKDLRYGKEAPAPDASGNINVVVDIGRWHMYNMFVTPVSKPYMKTTSDDKHNLEVEITGLAIKLTGQVGIKAPKLGLTTNYPFGGRIGVDAHFHYGMVDNTKSCTCKAVSDVKLDISNKWPGYIRDQIDKEIDKIVESYVRDFVCNKYRDFDIMDILHTGTFGVPINELFYLNGKVMGILRTRVDQNGVIFTANGSVVPNVKGHGLTNFQDNGMEGTELSPSAIDTNGQMQHVCSNYTASTFVYTAVKQGLLDHEMESSSLSAQSRTYFALECLGSDACIGSLFGKFQLSKKFPGKFVDVNVAFAEHVESHISESGIFFDTVVNANFHVGNYSLVELQVVLTTSCVPYFVPYTIVLKGNLTDVKASAVKVLTSNVGHIPIATASSMFTNLIGVDLVPKIKDILNTGVNFEFQNKHKPISLESVKLKLIKNAMIVTSSFATTSFD